VFYTREPDFQGSNYSKGTIHFIKDSADKQLKPVAFFSLLHQTYAVKADYLFKRYTEGEKVDIVYETADPSNASVYSLWGYWIRWKELVAFIVIFVVLYQIAANLTSNPTPEVLLEELEDREQKTKRRKYDD